MGSAARFEGDVLRALKARAENLLFLREPYREHTEQWPVSYCGGTKPKFPDLVGIDPTRIKRGLRRTGSGQLRPLDADEVLHRLERLGTRRRMENRKVAIAYGTVTRTDATLVVLLDRPGVDVLWEMKHYVKGKAEPGRIWSTNRRQFRTYVQNFCPTGAWCVVPDVDNLARVPRDFAQVALDGPAPATKKFSILWPGSDKWAT